MPMNPPLARLLVADPTQNVGGPSCTQAPILTLPQKHPRLTEYRAVRLPIEWDGERPAVSGAPPLLGEHTAEVVAEGCDDATIEELAARHVVQL